MKLLTSAACAASLVLLVAALVFCGALYRVRGTRAYQPVVSVLRTLAIPPLARLT